MAYSCTITRRGIMHALGGAAATVGGTAMAARAAGAPQPTKTPQETIDDAAAEISEAMQLIHDGPWIMELDGRHGVRAVVYIHESRAEEKVYDQYT